MECGNTSRVRVCHLTSVHSVYDIRIFHKECKSLAKAGFDVTLIATASSANTETVCEDGVRIITLSKPRFRWERFTKTLWKIYQLSKKANADIYHFHDPELITVGLLLRLHGKQVIYDVHEDYPLQILSKYWIPKRLRWIVAKGTELIERFAIQFLSGVVAATPAICKKYPPYKSVTVQNFPLLSEQLSDLQTIPYISRPPRCVYVGSISFMRGAHEMVQAMEYIPAHLNARLVLAGIFTPVSLMNELQRLQSWQWVEFVGWQARKDVNETLNQSRIGLVVLHPVVNYLESYPIKLFEYMSTGLPVIASDFPLWREIVAGAGCGILVDPLNPIEIARGIEYLLTHPQEAFEMGERGRVAVQQKYNWEAEAEKLVRIYRELSEQSSQNDRSKR